MFNITPEEAKKQFTTLSFNGKRIVADLFGKHKVTLVAEVADTIRLSAFFTVNDKEIESTAVDCLFSGPPVGFIKGISLYFLDTFVPYTLLKSLPKTIDREKLEELIEEYDVIVLGELPKKIGQLRWLDPYGMTATLLTPELSKELIDCGYRFNQSHFYCPKDKVFQVTETLVAGGWAILNAKNQQIIPLTDCKVETRIVDNQVEVQGELYFGVDKIALQTNLTLSENKVGLLPDNFKWKALFSKAKEREGKWILDKKEVGLVLDKFNPPAISPTYFNAELRDYQKQGLNWLNYLYQNGFSGLLADDMGLGKTVQALAFLTTIKGPALIIAPTSLLFNWQREIARFCPELPCQIYHGKERNADFSRGVVLTSYGLIRNDLPFFQRVEWDALIIDEAQYMKNRSSDTYQAITSLKSKFRLSITGTPVENRLDELKAHFQFLLPHLIEANEPIEMIRKKITPFTLRRTKDQVLKELPPLIEKTIFCEMSVEQKIAYDDLLQGTQNELEQTDNPIQILELILRLRQMACHPALMGHAIKDSGKTDQIISDIQTLIAEGQRVLVFSQFTSFLKIIKSQFSSCLYLDGETRNRSEIIDAFQNKENPLLFMSLKAGGVGLNLTQADTVLLLDPWWNEAAEMQAISRAHRMGRDKPVFTRRYISIGTIEEKIEELKKEKRALFDELFNESLSAKTLKLLF